MYNIQILAEKKQWRTVATTENLAQAVDLMEFYQEVAAAKIRSGDRATGMVVRE